MVEVLGADHHPDSQTMVDGLIHSLPKCLTIVEHAIRQWMGLAVDQKHVY